MIFVNSVREADGSLRIIERPVERATIDVVLPPLSDGAVIRQPFGNGTLGDSSDSKD
jgi:hypothetical protein